MKFVFTKDFKTAPDFLTYVLKLAYISKRIKLCYDKHFSI